MYTGSNNPEGGDELKQLTESMRSLDTEAVGAPANPETIETGLNPADLPARTRKLFLRHMIANLPEPVQNRICALKNNQVDQVHITEEFFREVYELERRFYGRSCALYDKRRDIVDGQFEPPPQPAKFPGPSGAESEIIAQLEASEEWRQLVSQLPTLPADAKGVPNFWLTVFRNVPQLAELVQEHDEPLLECLQDVRLTYEQDSYTVLFQFRPNNYLHNSSLLLSKRYFLQHAADPEYPFVFEGPEIVRCEGCHIHWRDGANLTLRTVQSRRRGRNRSVPKVVPRESFFRFFAPPQALDLSLTDEKTKLILGNDFEVGFLLRTQIVPKAVLLYTGDLVDNASEAETRSVSSEVEPESVTEQ